MNGQGIGQILVYAVVLVALGYPLGLCMARVYTRGAPARAGRARARLLARSSARRREQDWKAYAKTRRSSSAPLLRGSSTRSSGSRGTCS